MSKLIRSYFTPQSVEEDLTTEYPEVFGACKTQQDKFEETDINKILARYGAKEAAQIRPEKEPLFGDFTDAVDYTRQMQRVAEAQEMFMRLPTKVRDLANQDPARLIELVSDEANHEVLKAAGLEFGLTREEAQAAQAELDAENRNQLQSMMTKAMREATSPPSPAPSEEGSTPSEGASGGSDQ